MAFPSGYSKYQEVTVASSGVSSDLTDFIVYVDLSDLSKAGYDIFDTCRSDGGDIRVTKSDGTTELPREVVAIDTTAKTGELHIKYTGTLSSSSDTIIRIWYNGTDTEPSASSTYGSENVWTDYEYVSHDGGPTDSTGNSTPSSSNTSAGTGQVGAATDYNGTSAKVTVASDAIFDYGTGDFHVSAWANPDSTGNSDNIFSRVEASSPYAGFPFGLHSSDELRFRPYNNGGDNAVKTGVTDTWQHFHGRRDSGTTNAFRNAIKGGDKSNNKDIDNSIDIVVGGNVAGWGIGWFEGLLDELRMGGFAPSDDWISTEYSNQSAPSSFYSTGNEVDTGGAAPVFKPKLIMF